jgi:MFS family permease
LSFFWTALSVTGIITSLLAFGIFHLEGVNGIAGWRWLFLLEGLITLLLGIASFFLMPASAVQTKTWFRPKGWFTDRELAITVNRVLRDDPRKGMMVTHSSEASMLMSSSGDMHNRQAITPSRLWTAMKDYDLWPVDQSMSLLEVHADKCKIYAIGLICFIPQGPPAFYLTQSLRNLGFSTVSMTA